MGEELTEVDNISVAAREGLQASSDGRVPTQPVELERNANQHIAIREGSKFDGKLVVARVARPPIKLSRVPYTTEGRWVRCLRVETIMLVPGLVLRIW